jgi:hypothetical protein
MSGLALVKQGAQNRRNAATKLNLDSSRSHSVFTIELVASADGGEGDGGSGKQVCTLYVCLCPGLCSVGAGGQSKTKASAFFPRLTSCHNRIG